MPLPSEHAARQQPPERYTSFKRGKASGVSGVSFIYGIKKGGGTEVQSVRFDSDKWSVSQAKRWLKQHGFKTGVTPARLEATMENKTRMWAKVTKMADAGAAGGAAVAIGKLHIYDAIGGWDGIRAKDVVSSLAKLKEDGATDLHIHMHSPGGDVFEGVAIHNAIRSWDGGGKRTVSVDGLCASIASVIAMAGDRIKIAPHAMVMIHAPRALAMGTAEDILKTAAKLEAMTDVMAGIYADRTGLGKVECAKLIDAETWMTAKEAIDKGFADEMGPAFKKDDDDEEEEDDDNEEESAAASVRFQMVASALYKGCPEAAMGFFKKTEPTAVKVDAKADAKADAAAEKTAVAVAVPLSSGVGLDISARLLAVAEVKDEGEFAAKVAGWKERAVAASGLEAKLKKFESDARQARVTMLLSDAGRDGRLPPAKRKELEAKAPPFLGDPEQLEVYLSMLSPVVTTLEGGGARQVTEEPDPASAVTDQERSYAAKLGVDVASLAVFKAEGPQGLMKLEATKTAAVTRASAAANAGGRISR